MIINKKKILAIDDEPDILELFVRVLKEHEVKTAKNEDEALKIISKEEFNIVFLDVVMPEIDCIDLLGIIRKTSPKTKVIMMTGFAVEEKISQALKMGAVGVMRKPFEHIEDIIRAVERFG